MAKSKKQIETLEIEGELLNTVSYATYYCRLPLFTQFKIFNRDVESALAVKLSVTGSSFPPKCALKKSRTRAVWKPFRKTC